MIMTFWLINCLLVNSNWSLLFLCGMVLFSYFYLLSITHSVGLGHMTFWKIVHVMSGTSANTGSTMSMTQNLPVESIKNTWLSSCGWKKEDRAFTLPMRMIA